MILQIDGAEKLQKVKKLRIIVDGHDYEIMETEDKEIILEKYIFSKPLKIIPKSGNQIIIK